MLKHGVISSHKRDVSQSGTEENRVHGTQLGYPDSLQAPGWHVQRFLLTWADLVVKGNKGCLRHLRTAFWKSIADSCKCRGGLQVKASPGLYS